MLDLISPTTLKGFLPFAVFLEALVSAMASAGFLLLLDWRDKWRTSVKSERALADRLNVMMGRIKKLIAEAYVRAELHLEIQVEEKLSRCFCQ